MQLVWRASRYPVVPGTACPCAPPRHPSRFSCPPVVPASPLSPTPPVVPLPATSPSSRTGLAVVAGTAATRRPRVEPRPPPPRHAEYRRPLSRLTPSSSSAVAPACRSAPLSRTVPALLSSRPATGSFPRCPALGRLPPFPGTATQAPSCHPWPSPAILAARRHRCHCRVCLCRPRPATCRREPASAPRSCCWHQGAPSPARVRLPSPPARQEKGWRPPPTP